MAKTHHNVIVDGLAGSIGHLLTVRHYKAGHTVVGSRPTFSPDREFSPAQRARHQAFREAAAYAIIAKENPLYLRLAEGTSRNSYNRAISDFLHPPKVLVLDLGDWRGGPGHVLRIQALDDVQVCQVTIGITDDVGFLLEHGPARPVGALWWEYTTTATCTGTLRVTASATDLPGHVAQLTKSVSP